MLRIRLSRTGKKRQPSYRVVVAEKEAKRDGRVVERIGHYNPLTNPVDFQIKEERALYWLSVGAQPSDAVRILLNQQGTFDRLARLHAGESLDAVVSEFYGIAAETASPPATSVVEQSQPTVVDKVVDAASGAVEAVATPVVATVDAVQDAGEMVVEKIEEAIEAVLDADEEE